MPTKLANKSPIIFRLFSERVAVERRYQDKWLSDEKWYELFVYHCGSFVEANGVDRSALVRAVNFVCGDSLDTFPTNQFGIFRMKFRLKLDNLTSTNRNVGFYYVCSNQGDGVNRPTEGIGLHFLRNNPQNVAISRGKKRAGIDDDEPKLDNDDSDDNSTAKKVRRDNVDKEGGFVALADYWLSTEARNLFCPNSTGQVDEILRERVKILQSVANELDGWRKVVETNDVGNFCTPNDIFVLRWRSIFLSKAYSLALAHRGATDADSKKTFAECCAGAVDVLNALGINYATSGLTLQKWNRSFASKAMFPHPHPDLVMGKSWEPELFDVFPEAKERLNLFCKVNLGSLTLERIQAYIQSELLASLLPLAMSNSDRRVLDQYSRISLSTVSRWLHKCLGFSYKPRRKVYYVDGHELPSQRFERKLFVKNYIDKLELRTHRWIQFDLQFFASKIEDGELEESIKGAGYFYECTISGTSMVEYHVDTHPYFQQVADEKTALGGFVSIRKPPHEKKTIIWGQDEAAFSQNSFSSKSWVTGEGERPIIPKSDGYTLMVSAYQSREYGFGIIPNEDQLHAINQVYEGKEYKDSEAALEASSSKTRPKLTSSPFLAFIDVGINADGYWSGAHSIHQAENVFASCKEMFPQYHHVFLFDSSSGHCRKRLGALDALSMNKEFGGMQPKMHETKIEQEDGYLGPFQPSFLSVGDKQQMCFCDDDAGPWYLQPAEQETRKYDKAIEEGLIGGATRKTIPKSKLDMYNELAAQPGMDLPKHINKIPRAELVREMNELGLSLHKNQIVEGWCGKPKGLLQVLWERGWIDVNRRHEYRLVCKDEEGTNEELSLRILMDSCSDFFNEITQLQFIASQYDFEVIHTPKYHAELAGCGIEYSWGASKAFYRSIPHAERKTKEQFQKSVRKALGKEKLTKTTVRKCDARARCYICSYYVLDVIQDPLLVHQVMQTGNKKGGLQTEKKQDEIEASEDTKNLPTKISLPLIEKLQKQFKTHRCALDFDGKFVTSLVRSEEIG